MVANTPADKPTNGTPTTTPERTPSFGPTHWQRNVRTLDPVYVPPPCVHSPKKAAWQHGRSPSPALSVASSVSEFEVAPGIVKAPLTPRAASAPPRVAGLREAKVLAKEFVGTRVPGNAYAGVVVEKQAETLGERLEAKVEEREVEKLIVAREGSVETEFDFGDDEEEEPEEGWMMAFSMNILTTPLIPTRILQ